MTRSPKQSLILPIALLGFMVAVALAAPILPLADPVQQDIASRLAPASLSHFLGQDEYGRDVLSRIVWGGQISLAVAFAASLVAGIVGTILGLVGGYFRGVVEVLTVRTSEIVLCFPPLLLALLVVTLLGPGAVTLVFSLAILFTPAFTRIAYTESLSARSLDYVVAQKALGAPTHRILFRTMLPNIAPPILVQFSLTVAAAMVIESGLSFLGLGVVPPAPSWGLMIRGARGVMGQAPLLMLWPCLALCGAVLLLNFFCDRLRSVLDPRGDQAEETPSFLRRSAAKSKSAASKPSTDVLSVKDLTLCLTVGQELVPLVRDVSFTVAPGETVAIVGESGSGKTLTALATLGLLPSAIQVTRGSIIFNGRDNDCRDLLALSEGEMRHLRGNQISMVFQDATSSLNPLHSVGSQIAESITAHSSTTEAEAFDRVADLMTKVGMPDPKARVHAYPHELSGGQRQRAMIAAAIANTPRLLIADEPTTALDVTVQAQIVDLLTALKAKADGMSMIFVTHNLGIVSEIADKIIVMYAGEVVERGPVADVFANPRHPYTAALLASVPEQEGGRLRPIPGSVPLPFARPPGCSFASRCAVSTPECLARPPRPKDFDSDRFVRCIRWELAS